MTVNFHENTFVSIISLTTFPQCFFIVHVITYARVTVVTLSNGNKRKQLETGEKGNREREKKEGEMHDR